MSRLVKVEEKKNSRIKIEGEIQVTGNIILFLKKKLHITICLPGVKTAAMELLEN